MKEETLFEKIIKGNIPAVKLYEDEHCIAILDKFPHIEGQSLVIPKKPIDYVFDLDDETYAHIFSVAKKITQATDKALEPLRTCLVVEGFEIPHAHIKLYPLQDKKLKTVGGGPEQSNEELEKVAEKIRTYLN